MPDIARSLGEFDLGHLEIVASLWGVELQAGEMRQVIASLASALLHPELVHEMLGLLPEAARRALVDVYKAGGRMPWSLFTRRYGQVREMGAGRRDRERPHLNPVSPAEALWYRALVARAFFDTPAGPQEFAFIPADLVEFLPFPEGEGEEPLGRPAQPAERTRQYLVGDAILDDACTLLAALRLRMPVEALASCWSAPTVSPYPLTPAFLKTLLSASGLLDAQDLPQAEPTRRFLVAGRGEALAGLVQAWLGSREFDELRLLPGLSLEGEWSNDPLATRRTILSFLAGLPNGVWWSLRAFVEAIRRLHPDFQRPAGDYDSWYIRDVHSREFLRGFKHWERIDGALLRFAISGPLHWLGLVDLAGPSGREAIQAFRLSGWSNALLNGSPVEDLEEEDQPLQASSNGWLRLSRLSSRSIRYQIARLCEWGKLEGKVYRYRVTANALERAGQQALRASHLLALLRKHAPLTPPVLAKALERWEEHGSQARLERMVVLRVNSPEILQALKASRAARFLGDPLGPAAIAVRAGAWEKVLETLAELGYLGEVELDG